MILSACRTLRKIFRRILRGMQVFAKSMVDANGLSHKGEMLRATYRHILARAGWPGRDGEIVIHIDGLEMVLDPNRAEIVPFWEIWYEHEYELLPEFRATGNSRVVDVGGNVGFYAARQAMRGARVVVFEPSPAVFWRLVSNIARNRFRNVTPIRAAVGARAGSVDFCERRRSINSRVVEQPSDETIRVECVTLDGALEAMGIGHVDILKIDTEGAERAVLAGAASTLLHTDRAVVELHGNPEEELRLIDATMRAAGLGRMAEHGLVVYYQEAEPSRKGNYPL